VPSEPDGRDRAGSQCHRSLPCLPPAGPYRSAQICAGMPLPDAASCPRSLRTNPVRASRVDDCDATPALLLDAFDKDRAPVTDYDARRAGRVDNRARDQDPLDIAASRTSILAPATSDPRAILSSSSFKLYEASPHTRLYRRPLRSNSIAVFFSFLIRSAFQGEGVHRWSMNSNARGDRIRWPIASLATVRVVSIRVLL
jgi:hypothetical protein